MKMLITTRLLKHSDMTLILKTNLLKSISGEGWVILKNTWFFKTVININITALIIMIIFLIWKWSKIPAYIPLWFSKPWGQEQLAPSWWLIFLPVASIIIFFINSTIAISLTTAHRVFTQILMMTSLFLTILDLYILVNIINLIT